MTQIQGESQQPPLRTRQMFRPTSLSHLGLGIICNSSIMMMGREKRDFLTFVSGKAWEPFLSELATTSSKRI